MTEKKKEADAIRKATMYLLTGFITLLPLFGVHAEEWYGLEKMEWADRETLTMLEFAFPDMTPDIRDRFQVEACKTEGDSRY